MRFICTLSAVFLLLAPMEGFASRAPSQAAAIYTAGATPVVESLRLHAGAAATWVQLDALEPQAVEKVKAANSASRLKRLEIGIGRAVPEDSAHIAPAWRAIDGGHAAHVVVRSDGAQALRVGLHSPRMARGSEVRFRALNSGPVFGPFSAAHVRSIGSPFWSPVIEGDTVIMEVFVPGDALPDFGISVPVISHLFVSPSNPAIESLAKAAGACQVDAVCRTATDAQLAQASRAVARMTVTTASGSSGDCTGTLLNPSDGSFTPYFATAAHCVNDQQSASSITTHWFYERTGCGTGGTSSSYTQVSGGAVLLHSNTTSDFALVRLNLQPPSGAVFAGWDANPLGVGTPVLTLHHPDGDVKKVSPGVVTSFGPAEQLAPYGNFTRVTWNSLATGTTEGGSSGGGIFTGSASSGYAYRGGLLGGPSSCAAPPDLLYDDYSRFDLSFPYVAQYLSPANAPFLTPNALANPGFEAGATGWVQSSSSGVAIITSDAAIARTGSSFAWLGGGANITDTLHQDVTVPAGLARMQFWYRITTQESAAGSFDTMTVSVQNPATGATLATLESFSNLTPTNGWVQSQVYDLAAFAGQRVRIRFSASNDFSDPTSFRIDDLSLNGVAAKSGNNYTALWWNPAESGWGLNLNQQGDTAFATLFTYDTSGAPMWLVMSGGARQGNSDTFVGDLYRTTGPVFHASPFTPIGAGNVTRVGTMSLAFSGPNAGTLTYSVNGTTVTESIERQVYGTRAATCVGTTRARTAADNFQDLWWNTAESGWGLNITHQNATLFATLFTYGSNNQGLWLVMSEGRLQSDGSYLGDLYRTSGPAFSSPTWGGVSVTRVGTMRLRFSGGQNATLEYSVDGVNVAKSIVRQVFGSSAPQCTM